LLEATELGLFMISACGFGVRLEHPSSPWGKQSSAHFNPSVMHVGRGVGLCDDEKLGRRRVRQITSSKYQALHFLWQAGRSELNDRAMTT